MSEDPTPEPPRVFMAYSHDTEEHKSWVKTLATRLRANGVDVALDQWDVTTGGNLTLFMERAADTEYLVVAVITKSYKERADSRIGGVGFEAQMLSATQAEDIGEERVLPILRDNPEAEVPAFLKGFRWQDFRDDESYEAEYETLVRAIHEAPIEVAPPLGPNPFVGATDTQAKLAIRNAPARWHSPDVTGDVEFVCTQNSGKWSIGQGDTKFTLQLQYLGPQGVRTYRDPPDIRHVASIPDLKANHDLLSDVSQFDTSSRVVWASVGGALVFHNQADYWAVVEVLEVFTRDRIDSEEVFRFRYTIQTDRTSNFSDLIDRQ